MEINENLLVIKNAACLSEPIDRDKYFTIKAELQCDDVSTPDNHDGTFNQKFKAKIISPIEVTQGDKVIKGKDKLRQSQKMRRQIYAINNAEVGMDEEEFYDLAMNFLRANLHDTLRPLINK